LSYVGSERIVCWWLFPRIPEPALCLALSQPSAVAPGSRHAGRTERIRLRYAAGQIVNAPAAAGTKLCQRRLRCQRGQFKLQCPRGERATLGQWTHSCVSYTYSKSIDQASSISDPVNPYNFNATRALSTWTFRTTRCYLRISASAGTSHQAGEALDTGMAISGITRVTSGFR